MNFRLSALLLAMSMLLPVAARAQSHGGTMKESWDRAAKEEKLQPAHPAVKTPARTSAGDASEARQGDGAPWTTSRSPESRPWPFLPAHPAARDYHTANAQIIDSLRNLYCVSANYLRSLSARNDAALHPGAPPASSKDFSYDHPGPASASRPHETLQSLHKVLLDQLAQCLGKK